MTINDAIKEFDRIEANLVRSYKVLNHIMELVPQNTVFFPDQEEKYNEFCKQLSDLFSSLPPINGYRISFEFYDLNDYARDKMNAEEYGEIDDMLRVTERLNEPKNKLDSYKYDLKKSRRTFLRSNAIPLLGVVNTEVEKLTSKYKISEEERYIKIPENEIQELNNAFKSLDILLGSLVRPKNWGDMARHLSFHCDKDLQDIKNYDWPKINEEIENIIYSEFDPLPITINDVSELLGEFRKDTIITQLKWNKINDNAFERLIFNIIATSNSYQNPQWLTNTNAPDKGRDISTERVYSDDLNVVIKQRVIIQCKHWLSKSISLKDISFIKEQMKLWEPPKIDVCIIATSGRFTTDAIDFIEKNNQGDNGLRIEMWPESHLELILARHPDLVAEYKLRENA